MHGVAVQYRNLCHAAMALMRMMTFACVAVYLGSCRLCRLNLSALSAGTSVDYRTCMELAHWLAHLLHFSFHFKMRLCISAMPHSFGQGSAQKHSSTAAVVVAFKRLYCSSVA